MSKIWRNLVGLPLMGVALASTIGISSVAADYYSSISGTSSGTALADSLCSLISSTHTNTLSYDELWGAYETTDCFPGTNKIWDTYSEVLFTKGTDQAGSYKKEGDAYNREHTVPQSWFSEGAPMKGDAFHVLPTDGYVNNRRSSYVYGEVGSSTYESLNGSLLGSSALSGYSGTVFEPIDEYKGDIARGCMYMAIRYKNQLSNWTNGECQKVFKGSYPYLTNYALDLFTKWSHLDPVSDKEVIRNDAIYELQGNRNPFIDHPEFVDVIWQNSYQDSKTNTKYSVSDVVSAIDGLTSSNDSNLYSAYAKYCRLTSDDKKLVTNASTLFGYVETKTGTTLDLEEYWSNISGVSVNVTIDEAKVANVISLIDTLPDTITIENQALVESASAAYNNLNYKEKPLVTNYDKLKSAVLEIESIVDNQRAAEVNALIDALPSVVTEENRSQIEACRDAYNALTASQKQLITNYTRLALALDALAALGAKTYEKVTTASDLAVGDKLIIASSSESKALGGVVSKYYRAGVQVTKNESSITLEENTEVTELTLVAGVTSGTFAFDTGDGYLVPNTGTYSNLVTEATISAHSSFTITYTDGIVSIKSSGGCTNGQMAYDVSHHDFTCISAISNANQNVEIYKEQGTLEVNPENVANVIALIDALPNPLAYTDKAAVDAAFQAYTNLNSLEKLQITNSQELFDAMDEMLVLEFKDYAQDVIDLIDALPTTITLNDKNCTFAAREAYDSYAAEVQVYVTNYQKLLDKEAEVEALFAPINNFEAQTTKSSLKFSYTATVSGNVTTTYNLVTSASSLAVGDTIVIASKDYDYALSTTQNTNYRGQASITKGTNTMDVNNNVQLITLEAGTKAGTFALNVGTGYLAASSSSKNTMITQSNIDDNASFLITVSNNIASIVAKGSYSRNILCHNYSASRFSCYGSVQNAAVIYKKTGGASASYTVSDAAIRFGTFMNKETYQALLARGENVTFGIELSKDTITYKSYSLTPVFVENPGDKYEDLNGGYVQYAVVIPTNAANYNTYVYARAYVEIDGMKFYNITTGYSLHTLASYYIANQDTLGLDPIVAGALGEF